MFGMEHDQSDIQTHFLTEASLKIWPTHFATENLRILNDGMHPCGSYEQKVRVEAFTADFTRLAENGTVFWVQQFVSNSWSQGTMVRGQENIFIKRDAGQVVAGNAVTNIDKYIAGPRTGALFLAFFLVL